MGIPLPVLHICRGERLARGASRLPRDASYLDSSGRIQSKLRGVGCVLICVASFAANAEPRTWAFVQGVGGIAFETPIHNANGWSLPVRANLSGVEQITTRPTTLHSALACLQTAAVVEGHNIYLTIASGLPGDGHSSRCPPSQLGVLTPGRYRVFYRGPNEEPHFLGRVSIGL
jgi:hypothetical protein